MKIPKTLTYNGKETVYYRAGNGLPVILIHGFGEDSRFWRKVEDSLSEDYLLLIPDIPGFGASEIPETVPTMAEIARLAAAVANHEHVEKCVVIGHSMGGYATAAFAELFTDRLLGFGFVHSFAGADDDEKKKGRQKSIDFIEKNGRKNFVKELNQKLFNPAFAKAHPEEVEENFKMAMEISDETYICYTRAMMKRPDRTEVLKKANVPVLFLLGKDDQVLPYQSVLEQVQHVKHAHVHLLGGVGHQGPVEKPEESIEILKEFLRDCEV